MRPQRRDTSGRVIAEATWIILDGTRQISTGRLADERSLAEDELRNYVNGHHAGRPMHLCDETTALLRRTKVGNVYFITCAAPLFPIKIGFAVDVRVRMRALQGAMPWPLQLLLAHEGDMDKERELHQRFAEARMEGEWFARTDDVLDYIDKTKAVLKRTARSRA